MSVCWFGSRSAAASILVLVQYLLGIFRALLRNVLGVFVHARGLVQCHLYCCQPLSVCPVLPFQFFLRGDLLPELFPQDFPFL